MSSSASSAPWGAPAALESMAAGRTIGRSRTRSRSVDPSQAHRHRLQLRAGATTGDGYGRSALDPFGGSVGVCIGEVDAASELIRPLPTARARARAPLGWASEGGAGSLLVCASSASGDRGGSADVALAC
jgi:hypothetical protein